MARLYWALRMPDTLPLDLLSDRKRAEQEFWKVNALKTDYFDWFRNLADNNICDETSYNLL